jgi:hypothetical protein
MEKREADRKAKNTKEKAEEKEAKLAELKEELAGDEEKTEDEK